MNTRMTRGMDVDKVDLVYKVVVVVSTYEMSPSKDVMIKKAERIGAIIRKGYWVLKTTDIKRIV